MKILILATAIFALSCTKSNSKEKQMEAKVTTSVNNSIISFDFSQSEGNIVSYGVQLQDNSPTTGPINYIPSSSFRATETNPFRWVIIRASVTKTGVYKFQGTVQNEAGETRAVIFNVSVN